MDSDEPPELEAVEIEPFLRPKKRPAAVPAEKAHPLENDPGSRKHDAAVQARMARGEGKRPLWDGAVSREARVSRPQGDHRARAKELVAAITVYPDQDPELAAQVAAAEAALAVADELAKLRQLLAKKSPG